MEASARAWGFSPRAMLFLKVSAFAVMMFGHADWWLFDESFWIHRTLGRLVFPVFGIILAYHLAHMPMHRVGPLLLRLGIGASVSLPFYGYLQGSPLPLNILATYMVAVACWWLWLRGMEPVAVLVLVVGGAVVDYSWFGVVGVLLAAWWFRTESRFLLVPVVVFAAVLFPINGNWWALLAVPLVWAAAAWMHGPAPRFKWAFYVGYPLHLVGLALAKAAM